MYCTHSTSVSSTTGPSSSSTTPIKKRRWPPHRTPTRVLLVWSMWVWPVVIVAVLHATTVSFPRQRKRNGSVPFTVSWWPGSWPTAIGQFLGCTNVWHPCSLRRLRRIVSAIIITLLQMRNFTWTLTTYHHLSYAVCDLYEHHSLGNVLGGRRWMWDHILGDSLQQPIIKTFFQNSSPAYAHKLPPSFYTHRIYHLKKSIQNRQ